MRGKTACANRWRALAMMAVGVSAAGCSHHPLPDDVSHYPTEEIVKNVRCEAKEAVRQRIQLALIDADILDVDPERVLIDKRNFEKVRRKDPVLAEKFRAYGASAIAYRFEFEITENNDNKGAVTLAFPFTNGQVSLELGGKLNKERYAKRFFKTVETFEDLVWLDCRGWSQPHPNLAYPITGSIGVGRIINTFIDLTELGDAEKAFTDAIEFTTVARGKIAPVLEVTPVVDRFQVINANGEFESKRNDLHKLTVAIAFPDLTKVGRLERANRQGAESSSGSAIDRALIEMCIAEGEAREDRFAMLRDYSPKDYCRRNGIYAPW